MEERLHIAIVKQEKCKPSHCIQSCVNFCPINRTNKLCIDVKPTSRRALISEELCIGCGNCVKWCPFNAIEIIQVPQGLVNQTTHRYGQNMFKLYRLPTPRLGAVLGIVGGNGTGKTTALKIISGKLTLNLGNYRNPPVWQDILPLFRGSELQAFFTKIANGSLKATMKPQYVEAIAKVVKGQVGEVLQRKDQVGQLEYILRGLNLETLLEREVATLSGGELQRFAIGVACLQDSELYMFDEPSSYLDIRQRLKAGDVIRSKTQDNTCVVVVEHDLALLDYLSDFICIFYGRPASYGVVTAAYGVRQGINTFLDGFIPMENIRFRDTSLSFKAPAQFIVDSRTDLHSYPVMSKIFRGFHLRVEAGEYSNSEIIVLLGQNGCGKTTFLKMLAGKLESNEGVKVMELSVSYKPQTMTTNYSGVVRRLLQSKIPEVYQNHRFQKLVIKPLQIDSLLDSEVAQLSGGHLQLLALAITLGRSADLYLIDEPSAYLSSEQRVVAASVIKRFMLSNRKTAFIVEHDFIMATYLADRVIVYEGEPGLDCVAKAPETLVTGMNRFLSALEITFRRDPTNYRPRINKLNSIKDREQKASGQYFFI